MRHYCFIIERGNNIRFSFYTVMMIIALIFARLMAIIALTYTPLYAIIALIFAWQVMRETFFL
jgi:hypothetical protein